MASFRYMSTRNGDVLGSVNSHFDFSSLNTILSFLGRLINTVLEITEWNNRENI